MSIPSTSSNLNSGDFEKICTICGRPAFCRFYGVVSCDACKMFFRRITLEKINYKCKKINKCGQFEFPLKCKGCRSKKCQDLGMRIFSIHEVQVQNRKDEGLGKLLKELTLIDRKRYEKYISFYTNEDPSLEDVLNNPNGLENQQTIYSATTLEWSFLAVYSVINHFLNFGFIQTLESQDKMKLFQLNTLKTNLLCGGMRAITEQRDRMVTPSGQEIYAEVLVTRIHTSSDVLQRIRTQVVGKLIELKVTNDEFLLLSLIFFCNPVPCLSTSAISLLSSRQQAYTSALFQYCQLNYQGAAPSRLADLLSISHVLNRNSEDIKYISMILQGFMPDFSLKQLVKDTWK